MILGSVIARLGSKRLPFKNLLPFQGVPLVRLGVQKLIECTQIDQVVLSTESELIARQVEDLDVMIIKRPDELSGDGVPSIPVFQHLVDRFPCEVHVNYNINFPHCENRVIERAIEIAKHEASGESLSVPFAVWAQTDQCLKNYGDPWKITATSFEDAGVKEPDIHTVEDLLAAHQVNGGAFQGWHHT